MAPGFRQLPDRSDPASQGSYGLFVSNSVHGEWDHVYAFGFSDSGLYVGACPDCYGTVCARSRQNNQMGYSGTNVGGHLIVQDSVFRHNGVSVGPALDHRTRRRLQLHLGLRRRTSRRHGDTSPESSGHGRRTGRYSPGQSAYASSGSPVSFAADAPYFAATSLTG